MVMTMAAPEYECASTANDYVMSDSFDEDEVDEINKFDRFALFFT